MERLPSRIWWVTSRITSGWYSGFFQEFEWEQSMTMLRGNLALARAFSARDTDTLS